MINQFINGLRDFYQATFDKINIPLILGWVDIQQRYRRSKLGPIWLTISMSVTVIGMGLVFGTIFGTPLREFLPFLALGMILWGLITTVITEGCNTFAASEGIIKQISLPYFSHVYRMVWRNLLIMVHNIMILPFIMLVFLISPSWINLLFVPGIILLLLNLIWIAMIMAIVCTRYRDLTQIIISVLQLWFFITPIIWQPELMLEKGRAVFIYFNPFYHLIEIVRAPLLGQMPSSLNWMVCIGMCIIGWLFNLYFLGKYRKRIAYWL